MKHKKMINPSNNTTSFGVIKPLTLNGINTDSSDIYLFYGKHIGPNKGFGAEHILKEHYKEMKQLGFVANHINDVPQYVCNIVKVGTPLYFESAGWRKTRLLAVNSINGTAVLEYINRREKPIWSVVTAFLRRNSYGQLVSKIL